jgi:hypothetical protein
MFFVASAPLDPAGHINLSPKGVDSFGILDPKTVAYLDFTGSGVETIAHLRENGRVERWAENQGPGGIADYKSKNNLRSIDGLPGLPAVSRKA